MSGPVFPGMSPLRAMPAPLEKGDTVALLATSGPCDPASLDASVNALRAHGLRVRVMDSCRGSHGYLAAADEVRANDVNEAFADRRIAGIFAVRGGYGAQRILPMLDYTLIRHNPKIFAGYSDITALHTVFNQICGLITFHAPMPATEICRTDIDPYTLRAFTRFIFADGESKAMPGKKSAVNPPIKPNDKPAVNPAALSRRPVGNGIAAPIRSQVLRNPDNQPLETIVPGYAEGRLCGGNLTLIASSLGTPFALDAADSILFLEEVGEDAYRVDRLLLQLKLAGVFADCRGILLGSFHPQTLESLRIAVEELLIPERKPILGNIACGHCLPSLTLPLGARAFLDAGRGVWGIRL